MAEKQLRWPRWLNLSRSLAVLACVVGLFGLGHSLAQGPSKIVEPAVAYAEQTVVDAAVVFVALRTLNAVLSTVQEVEVGGSLVLQGSVQPLRSLEPVDDTVERASSLVFGVALGASAISLALGPVNGIGFACLALGGIFSLIFARSNPLLWMGVAFGLALPIALFLSGLLVGTLTERVWLEHDALLQEIAGDISAEAEVAVVDDLEESGGGLNFLRGAAEEVGDLFAQIGDYRVVAATVWDRSDELLDSYIRIISVFLFRIGVLPHLLFAAVFLTFRLIVVGRARQTPAT